MRVFITGATGYIGHAVAKAFRAKGHTVYGLVRSEAKGHILSLDEIWPVIGDLQQPDSYIKILDKVEVAVHCAFDFSQNGVDYDMKTIETMVQAFSHSSLPRSILYTSGIWLYGSTGTTVVDESSPLNPIDLVQWRVEHEKRVLDASTSHLKTVVLRPGCVYGNVGGLTNLLFSSIHHGEVLSIGEGSNHWAMVHVQDLAHAYVSVAEKELNGVTFNVVDDSSFTLREIVEAIARSAGLAGKIRSISLEEAEKQMGPIARGLVLDQQIDNSRIKRLLKWQIHHAPFIREMDLYFHAWKTTQETEEF
jgi:nucleoside-diphosphate-sugar epimerase